MSAEPGPASRDLERAVASVFACACLGGVGAVGETWALTARHMMSETNVLGAAALAIAGIAAGLLVGVLSLPGRGKRK